MLSRSRREKALLAHWGDHDATYHHFQGAHGIGRVMAIGALRVLPDGLSQRVTESQDAEVYLGIGGDVDDDAAETFYHYLASSKLKPPLKLHLAFVGHRTIGEQLRPYVEPVLAQYIVLDPST